MLKQNEVYLDSLPFILTKLTFSFEYAVLCATQRCAKRCVLIATHTATDVRCAWNNFHRLIFPLLCIQFRIRRRVCMEWRVHFAAATAAATMATTTITSWTRFMPFLSTQLLISFSVSFMYRGECIRCALSCTCMSSCVWTSEWVNVILSRNGLGGRYYISTTIFCLYSIPPQPIQTDRLECGKLSSNLFFIYLSLLLLLQHIILVVLYFKFTY